MGRAISTQELVKIVAENRFKSADLIALTIAERIRELDPCYGKAMDLPGEPRIFVLIPTDDLAPQVVHHWANQAQDLPEKSRRRQLVPEARDCADSMITWKQAHPDS